jgi:hypothetical protein
MWNLNLERNMKRGGGLLGKWKDWRKEGNSGE